MSLKPKSIPTDDFACSTHNDQVVALYCQTCEDLICPRCITQGPSSKSLHKDHIYLDMCDAYHIKKKQLQQVMTNFRDATQTRKNERMELDAMGQKLKLELLRKRTMISKQTHCLHDAINKQEKHYLRHLEGVLKPALMRNEARFSEADFDVVSRDGILGSSDSVCSIHEEKAIKFLRGQKNVEKAMVKLSVESVPRSPDNVPELRVFQRESLSLNQCKQAIAKTFCCTKQVPSRPRVLPSWCTVGQSSASIAFKCANHRQIHSYIIVCKPHRTDRPADSLTHTEHSAQSRADQLIIKRNKVKFAEGNYPIWWKHAKDSQVFRIRSRSARVLAVIRNLKPEIEYIVKIHAVNSHGAGEPTMAYLTTLPVAKVKGQGYVRLAHPRSRNWCKALRSLFISIMKYFIFFMILLWVVLAVYISYTEVCAQLHSAFRHICDLIWDFENPYFDYMYKVLCPQKIPDFISFQRYLDIFSMNSGLEMADKSSLEGVQPNKFSLNMVLKWLVEFGENRTGLLF